MKKIGFGRVMIMLLLILATTHCKEVFEKSLDKDSVLLTGPANNLVTDSSSLAFFWQPIDSGIRYELQIVSPGFDSVARLVTDSTTQANIIYFSLSPGLYQWRVRAFNSSSTTPFGIPRTLTIQ